MELLPTPIHPKLLGGSHHHLKKKSVGEQKFFRLKKVNQKPIRQKVGCGLQVPRTALLTTYGCGLAIATHTHRKLFWLLKANRKIKQTEILNEGSKQLGGLFCGETNPVPQDIIHLKWNYGLCILLCEHFWLQKSSVTYKSLPSQGIMLSVYCLFFHIFKLHFHDFTIKI